MITNSSFPSTAREPEAISAYLFPDFRYFQNISLIGNGPAKFVTDVLLSLNPSGFGDVKVGKVTVLICGHGGRDQRCGILGPLLEMEFLRLLKMAGLMLDDEGVRHHPMGDIMKPSYIGRYMGQPQTQRAFHGARVARVSHVGGHKWAGNVILYFPPQSVSELGPSPLAGKGIWYGRVEPKHVEGIISETIKGAKVIKELFRGVMEPNAVFGPNNP